MTTGVECIREQDVLDALSSSRWPSRCDDELRSHVAGCGVCTDLIEVVEPLLDIRDETWSQVRVPSPGTVWWRAQLRARRESARQASRPIGVVQAAAGTIAAAVAIVAVWAVSPWLGTWTFWTSGLPSFGLPSFELPRFSLPDVSALAKWWWAAALLAAWLVLGPLAVYLTLLDRED